MPAAGSAAACMDASDTSARGLVRARGGRVVLLLWLLLGAMAGRKRHKGSKQAMNQKIK
jgi:hypothetical protein